VPLPLSPEVVDTDTSRDDNEGASCFEWGGGWVTKIASCRELEDLVFERIGGENGAVRSLGVASSGR